MHPDNFQMHRTLRCGARTRSGNPCRSPAVRGKRRCRMHGGAAGSGAPTGNQNALRHGHYSAEAIARRRDLSEPNVRRAMKPGGRLTLAVFRPASDKLWPNAPLEAVRHLLPPIPTPGPEEPGPFSWADPARVHRILESAGFSEVSLTPLDPVIQLAGPAGEAEAADFVMTMGPLARVLPSLSAAQRENVRATLEVYFRGHTSSQGVVLPAANWVVRARV
jgi:hypothetical protein